MVELPCSFRSMVRGSVLSRYWVATLPRSAPKLLGSPEICPLLLCNPFWGGAQFRVDTKTVHFADVSSCCCIGDDGWASCHFIGSSQLAHRHASPPACRTRSGQHGKTFRTWRWSLLWAQLEMRNTWRGKSKAVVGFPKVNQNAMPGIAAELCHATAPTKALCGFRLWTTICH